MSTCSAVSRDAPVCRGDAENHSLVATSGRVKVREASGNVRTPRGAERSLLRFCRSAEVLEAAPDDPLSDKLLPFCREAEILQGAPGDPFWKVSQNHAVKSPEDGMSYAIGSQPMVASVPMLGVRGDDDVGGAS